MKLFYSLIFVSLATFGFSQSEKLDCGQLPMLKTDTEATPITNFDKLISESLNVSNYSETNKKVVFKTYVDCNGRVIKFKIENSNLDDSANKTVSEIIEKSTWTAAKLGGEFVTTIVFISFDISNRQVKTVIQ